MRSFWLAAISVQADSGIGGVRYRTGPGEDEGGRARFLVFVRFSDNYAMLPISIVGLGGRELSFLDFALVFFSFFFSRSYRAPDKCCRSNDLCMKYKNTAYFGTLEQFLHLYK